MLIPNETTFNLGIKVLRELIKKEEGTKPKSFQIDEKRSVWTCGACEVVVNPPSHCTSRFCGQCGTRVLWSKEDRERERKANGKKCNVRVTRFNDMGTCHSVISEQPIKIVMETDNSIGVDMPYRFWSIASGGRLEIEACS